MKGLLINTSGVLSMVDVKDDGEIRTKIGGYIEVAKLQRQQDLCMLIDEDAQLAGKKVNQIASYLGTGVIAGDVLVMKYEQGEFKSLE
jgi:hypothetical protein